MAAPLVSLDKVLLAHWSEIERYVSGNDNIEPLDGHSLDLAAVQAVARYES